MWLVTIGVIAGIISGMGIGGGTVLIPALVIFFNIPQQAAQGINLLYFIPTAIISLIIHIRQGNIEKGVVLKISSFGVISAIIGSVIAVKIDPDMLKTIFAGFLFVMGVYEISRKDDKKEKPVDTIKDNIYKEGFAMEISDFEKLKNKYTASDVNGKINIYVDTEGLTQEQYKELLRDFPLEAIDRLEAALG